MPREADLNIFIVPGMIRLKELEDYDPNEVGRAISNKDQLVVNKVDDGYSIIYAEDDFIEMDLTHLVNEVVRIMTKHLPNTSIDIYLEYLYLTDDEDRFEMVTAEKVMMFDVAFNRLINNNNLALFKYYRTESVKVVANRYMDIKQHMEKKRRKKDNIQYGDGNSITDILNGAIGRYDDDDDEDDKPKKKKKKTSYDSSRVLKNAKNPKRSYNRHGIIIADSKADIKKDARIIRKFLKEFIPGSSRWKRDLREDLEKRWLKMFVVTNKRIKKLNKHCRNANRKKKTNSNVERTLEITRQMFRVPVDNWNNPDK